MAGVRRTRMIKKLEMEWGGRFKPITDRNNDNE